MQELLDSAPKPAEPPEVSLVIAETLPGTGVRRDETQNLPMLLESLLFVAAEPTPISQLAQALETAVTTVENALAELAASCTAAGRGVRLQRKGDRVQLTTAPEVAPYVERFLGLNLTSKLSAAALETLSVIAYRQPLTRADIEAVRGVSCDGVLRTLIARELVEPVGRLEQVGRPYLYGTTFQFLQYFGIADLASLPPLSEGTEISGDILESMIEENEERG